MSLTSSERRALQWLLALFVIGSAVQLTRSWRSQDDVTADSTAALKLQLVAVDSARRAGDRHDRRTRRVVTRAPTSPTAGSRRVRDSPRTPVSDAPTGPQVRHAAGTQPSRVARKRTKVPTLGPVDVDRAEAAELERLPRIGPALAARIIVDRSQRGPFGSLRELQRVRGIGPRLAEGLAPVVTFSGTRRPTAVQH